jgi:hypothetical protein
MREQVVTHVFLVARRGRDVHQRACQFEKIHPNRIFLDERNERKEPRRYKSRLLPLDSASSVSSRSPCDPQLRTTVDRPWTYPPTAAASATAAISADNNHLLPSTSSVPLPANQPVESRAPFARASEAARNCAPAYSWPPHLYQEQFKSRRAMPDMSTRVLEGRISVH